MYTTLSNINNSERRFRGINMRKKNGVNRKYRIASEVVKIPIMVTR
jgi:hypothetical protein